MPVFNSRLALRCYPRGWRRRYGEELLELLAEQTPGGQLSSRVFFDAVKAGLAAHVRRLLRPGASRVWMRGTADVIAFRNPEPAWGWRRFGVDGLALFRSRRVAASGAVVLMATAALVAGLWVAAPTPSTARVVRILVVTTNAPGKVSGACIITSRGTVKLSKVHDDAQPPVATQMGTRNVTPSEMRTVETICSVAAERFRILDVAATHSTA